MTNGNDRLDRIEGILERVSRKQEEMVARQQYHDEAFERHDAEMKSIREAMAINTKNIASLVHIAELHQRRLEELGGGETS